MTRAKIAFEWITGVLREKRIPFQIVGGLAARAYGAKRPLVDIDIYIPRKGFDRIRKEIDPYIVFGPAPSPDKYFKDCYAELRYRDQTIEIAGADNARIYDRKQKRWKKLGIDFSKSTMTKIFGDLTPTIPKGQLIKYKKILNRSIDKKDIAAMKSF